MPLDAWLPVGYELPGKLRVRGPVAEGRDWQICEIRGGGRVLLAREPIARRWFDAGFLEEGTFSSFEYGTDRILFLDSGESRSLEPIELSPSPDTKSEALARATAFAATRAIEGTSSLHDAIYVERFSKLLPTWTLSSSVPDDVVFGAWLTGGVPVSARSRRRLRSLMTWIGSVNLDEVLDTARFHDDMGAGLTIGEPSSDAKNPFELAGRPALGSFFREHVIDIIENEARYKALGIDFPSAIILHGPPGCGKTFAVERLIEYLGWPSFSIEASTVASPYIHETSKKVATVFNEAMKAAPSVLVIDEMEAFLTDRQTGASSGQHHVEEVAEFLRRIPEAIKRRVLIIAMTNRIEMIDPAILRRGRFDHVVKVDMASEEEVLALLNKLTSALPCESSLDVVPLAKALAGRPLSDVAFIAREGARLAARSGKDRLDQQSLDTALAAVERKDDGSSRKIGFN